MTFLKSIATWFSTVSVVFWLKIIITLAVIVLVWWIRGVYAERERVKAVAAAVEVVTQRATEQLKAEQVTRKFYQDLAENRLVGLAKAINNIKITHTTVVNDFTKEVAANPTFYAQPLPPEGFTQWVKARKLAVAVPQPAH